MEELFVCLKACQLIYKMSMIEQRLGLVLFCFVFVWWYRYRNSGILLSIAGFMNTKLW